MGGKIIVVSLGKVGGPESHVWWEGGEPSSVMYIHRNLILKSDLLLGLFMFGPSQTKTYNKFSFENLITICQYTILLELILFNPKTNILVLFLSGSDRFTMWWLKPMVLYLKYCIYVIFKCLCDILTTRYLPAYSWGTKWWGSSSFSSRNRTHLNATGTWGADRIYNVLIRNNYFT